MSHCPWRSLHAIALATIGFSTVAGHAADWKISGTILTPSGLVSDSIISISNEKISAIGPSSSTPATASAAKMPGVILPRFIDLHNHFTWNVLPRWVPGRRFGNRYDCQDTPQYAPLFVAPPHMLF